MSYKMSHLYSHRNTPDSPSIHEMSTFINALYVTCHDIHNFHGYDLLQILGERMTHPELLNPGAYLTLCNTNWTHLDVNSMVALLHPVNYPFVLGKIDKINRGEF